MIPFKFSNSTPILHSYKIYFPTAAHSTPHLLIMMSNLSPSCLKSQFIDAAPSVPQKCRVNQPSLQSFSLSAPTQETFGIQNPSPQEATILQDSIRNQGVANEATVFGASNDGDAAAQGHPAHPQGVSMANDIPQNYLASHGKLLSTC